MKTLKKAWIFLLLVCLAALFSTTALADDATSGTCGENATWTLEGGVLTISGTGDMADYSSIYDIPWYWQWSSVNSVVVEYGITSIGDMAFFVCRNLTNVTIPDSVTSIGDSAFALCGLTDVTIPDSVISIGERAFGQCRSLTSVTIPGSVMSIGDFAFIQCSSLTSVTISDSVPSIGNYAFEYCSSLESVTIPDSVVSIGDMAFAECSSLVEILVSEGNTAYDSENGVLFSKDKTELICYPAGKAEISYEIPDGVTSLHRGAFYRCSTLTSVTIPDSVISIGIMAFDGCSGLTSIAIPDSVVSIGRSAFRYCNSLTEILVSEKNTAYCSEDGILFNKDKTELICCPPVKGKFSYEIPDGVIFIDDYAFMGCNGLMSVTIPDSVISIGYSAFEECNKFTSITIPNSVTSIGNYAFFECDSLTSVTIGNGVTYIGEFAFDTCDSLTDIYYCGSEEDWNAIEIDEENEYLTFATIHYNSTGSGSTDDTGDTGDTEATVSETLAAISETATETEIKTAVQAIAADELAAELSADTDDTGVTAQLAALEEQAGVTTSVTVADALAGSFDSSAVTVTGGALNTTTGDAVLTLSAAESADGSAYNNALAFSLTLTGDGVDSHALTVPVKITLPVPATHDPETLVLLHYADGENPVELETTIYESGTQWYVSFVLTSFSDFVMYDSSEVETSTPGDLNGDGEVNAGDLTVLARHVGKVEYITDKTALANADVTGDGNVDASDLTKLAQYVGKIISSLD